MGRKSKQTFPQRRHAYVQKAHKKMLNITNNQRNANQSHSEASPHTCQKGHHQSLPTINAGLGVEKTKLFYSVSGNGNWYKHYEQYGGSFKKINIELPYDPEIPLLGIYLEKTIIQKGTCAPLSTAAIFPVAETQRKPKCPSTQEWIKKWSGHTLTMEYYSVI